MHFCQNTIAKEVYIVKHVKSGTWEAGDNNAWGHINHCVYTTRSGDIICSLISYCVTSSVAWDHKKQYTDPYTPTHCVRWSNSPRTMLRLVKGHQTFMSIVRSKNRFLSTALEEHRRHLSMSLVRHKTKGPQQLCNSIRHSHLPLYWIWSFATQISLRDRKVLLLGYEDIISSAYKQWRHPSLTVTARKLTCPERGSSRVRLIWCCGRPPSPPPRRHPKTVPSRQFICPESGSTLRFNL